MKLSRALDLGAGRVGKREAALILSHVTGLNSAGIMLDNKPLPESSREKYFQYIEKRRKGEPLQYVLGNWEFFGLELKTDKRALIPRPETELLVEEALKFISAEARVLDLCTGSGCIALAVACLTGAAVTAVDISPDALELARENAAKLGLEPGRVDFIQSDLLENVNGEFDVIISNPPYILSGDMAGLPSSVRDYEPLIALDGGVGGLDFYRRLIPRSFGLLSEGGALFLEIGPVAVRELMSEAGFEDIRLVKDYAGIDRIVYGVKNYV